MQGVNTIFYIAILIMSVVIHEVSHGFLALRYGDKTALNAGRLTLNPLKHLDLFGSVLLPAFLFLTTHFAFGWAKPVPYNPDNLSNRKWGTFFVSFAGILANFFIAIVFGTILRFAPSFNVPQGFYFIVSTIVIVNLALGIFNLVPIPPLDGSKILFSLLPWQYQRHFEKVQQYSLILLIIFVFMFSKYLLPILTFAYGLVTGSPLHLG